MSDISKRQNEVGIESTEGAARPFDWLGQAGATWQANADWKKGQTPEPGPSGGFLSGLGAVAGGLNIWKGAHEVQDEDTRFQGVTDIVGGAANVGQGAMGLASGLTEGVDLATASALGPMFGVVGGGAQLAGALHDYETHGASNDNIIGGATGLTNLVGGAAAGLGAGAAATFAGGAALALGVGNWAGKELNEWTEETSKDSFKDDKGRRRTAQEAAVDFGLSEEEKYKQAGFGEGSSHALAGIASMGQGVANVGKNLWRHLFHDDTEHDPANPSPVSKVFAPYAD